MILEAGYEQVIRSKLGVKVNELPDEDINQPLIKDMAEGVVVKRVPNHDKITDSVERLFLQNAVISYICYLLCPSMSRRLNQEVTTLDTKWKKQRVDWDVMAQTFLEEFETSLASIESVEVITYDPVLMMIATTGDTDV